MKSYQKILIIGESTLTMKIKKITDFKNIDDLQEQAISFIKEKLEQINCALCVTPVGTGKTRIAANCIEQYLSQTGDNKQKYILILCPSEDIIDDSWETELTRKNIKHIKLDDENFAAFKLKKSRKFIGPKSVNERVFLLTYAMFSHPDEDGQNNVDFFINNPPDFVIIDEVHNISNTANDDTKLSRNVLFKVAYKKCLGLTATPLVNIEEEISRIAEILMKTKFILTEKKELFYTFSFIVNGEHENHFRTDTILFLPLHNSIESKCSELLEEKNPLVTQPIISKLLLQGCIKSYDNKPIRLIPENSKTTKEQCLQLLIENIPPEDKIVIFDEYKDNLTFLSKQDWMKPYSPILYHGSLDDKKLKRNLTRFKNNKDCRIILATKAKAGTGLNLQIANHLIILTNPWTSKDIIQMEGRINRTNQKKHTFCYILTDLIDEKLQAIMRKNELAEEYIGKNSLSDHTKVSFNNVENFETDFIKWFIERKETLPVELNLTQFASKVIRKYHEDAIELINWLWNLNLETIEDSSYKQTEIKLLCSALLHIEIAQFTNDIKSCIESISERYEIRLNDSKQPYSDNSSFNKMYIEFIFSILEELRKYIVNPTGLEIDNLFVWKRYSYINKLEQTIENIDIKDLLHQLAQYNHSEK